MLLFWFVSFINGIKRIRDKTFCFDVQLEPNPCTRHTLRIHGARCNYEELRGIRMSKFPPLLLGKWAMTGSLFQNMFCHLQVNGEWLTILESLKKKKENKQGCSYELTQQTTKGYGLCGVHPGLLPQTSLGDSLLLPSSLLSLPFLVRLLPWVDLGLFLYHYLYLFLPCLHVRFPEDMCTSSLDFGPTRGGDNSLRSRYIWRGIFCLFLGDEKLTGSRYVWGGIFCLLLGDEKLAEE